MKKVYESDPYSGEKVFLQRFNFVGLPGFVRVRTASAEHDYPISMSEEECLAAWLKMRQEFHDYEK